MADHREGSALSWSSFGKLHLQYLISVALKLSTKEPGSDEYPNFLPTDYQLCKSMTVMVKEHSMIEDGNQKIYLDILSQNLYSSI